MCANSENHDRFLSLFTVLIESSFRHTTECVTGGNHLLEVCSSLKNRVENKIISHFWFCLPSPFQIHLTLDIRKKNNIKVQLISFFRSWMSFEK